jgi:hypothetical protein
VPSGDTVGDRNSDLVAGWGGCHLTCLILADAGMAQDQVAAADDAATVA